MLQEVVLCSSAPSTGNSSLGSISLNDFVTGTSLFTLKQTGAGSHNTAFIESRDGQGGFILCAQSEKALLNVYSFQKDQMTSKMVLPEKLCCVSVDRRGLYCAGGTVNGRIYLWEVASGILFNSWEAHYRKISVLRFTDDGAALISGSEDAAIHVWEISRLVDNMLRNDIPVAYCSYVDHTLPIMDIIIGLGRFPSCRVLSSSLDGSAKMWDLTTKSLLSTFIFPGKIGALTMSNSERVFFAASLEEGSIHRVNLFRKKVDDFGRMAMEAIGGAGSSGESIRVGEESAETSRLISVGQTITCLALTMTASHLIAGLATGLVHIYDTTSHQLLRSITTHKGQPISFVATMLKPMDLIGHIVFNGVRVGKDGIPVRAVLPFQRTREPKVRDAHEVTMLLPSWNVVEPLTAERIRNTVFEEHAFFMKARQSNVAIINGDDKNGTSLQSRVTELESEIATLRNQLSRAKGINDTMWETVVKKLILDDSPEDETNGGDSAMQDGMIPLEDREVSRKRART